MKEIGSPQVALIIPALNEAESIAGVVSAASREAVDLILVGDNGSDDDTAALARAAGATVVLVKERGYGAACAGALSLLPDSVEIVVFADADGSDDLSELPSLILPIQQNEADLVIGARVAARRQPGSLTPQQRFGNRLATTLIQLLYRHSYSDLGPFRAVRRTTLDAMQMRDRRYGWTVEMQLRALQLGVRVVEVPVSYRRRIGRSKISGTLTGVLKAGWWILYTIWKYRKDPGR